MNPLLNQVYDIQKVMKNSYDKNAPKESFFC